MATFGDTTLGTIADLYGVNEVQARKFTSFPGGDVSSVSLRCKYNEAANWKIGIYAADGTGGTPGTLLWTSEEFTMTSDMTSFEFRTVNKAGGGSTTINAGDIWFAMFFSGNVYLADGSDGGTGIYGSASYSSAPASAWSYGTGAWDRLTRIYLTYIGIPDTSPVTKFPGTTATTNAVSPYDDDNWVSIDNIKADDTSYASITSSTFDANDYSYLAKATNFGFNVPAEATIDGIVVETLGATYAGSTAANWVMMQLLNASGTAEGDNNAADGGTLALTNDAVDTFGGATDKWGVTLTPAMVNDPDFGVQFALQAKYANTDIRIEYLKMTVYFSPSIALLNHLLLGD